MKSLIREVLLSATAAVDWKASAEPRCGRAERIGSFVIRRWE